MLVDDNNWNPVEEPSESVNQFPLIGIVGSETAEVVNLVVLLRFRGHRDWFKLKEFQLPFSVCRDQRVRHFDEEIGNEAAAIVNFTSHGKISPRFGR
jgi:hypothetical protein